MATFKFKGIDLFPWVKVTAVKDAVLPPISRNTMKVTGMVGSYDFGNEIGERNFEIEYTIVANSQQDLKVRVRQLADFLYSEDYERLIFTDEPLKYYMAKVTDTSDYDTITKYGQGSIKFVCKDPFAYELVEKSYGFNQTSADTPVQFNNEGTTDTFPKMKFTITQPLQTLTIATADDVLQFGKPLNADQGETPISPKTEVFNEAMESVTGWSNATTVPRGVVQGTLVSNGYKFVQANNDYGSGSNWHGGSMKKALYQPAQDFVMSVQATMATTSNLQRGKVEIYLLDASNNIVCSISMKDAWDGGRWNQAEAYVGNTLIMEQFAGLKHAWSDFIDGRLEIERKGNRWRCYVAKITNGVHNTRYSTNWVDLGNTVMQPITQCQVHIAQQGTSPVASMNIGHVSISRFNTVTPSQVPYAFQTGDELFIDNATGLITRNGEPYFSALDPSSSFLKLKKGVNGVVVAPHGAVSNGEVIYRQRWL